MRTCSGLLRVAEVGSSLLIGHSVVSAVSKLRLIGFISGAVLIDVRRIVMRQVHELFALVNAIGVNPSPANELLGDVAVPDLIDTCFVAVAPQRLPVGVSIACLLSAREVRTSVKLRLHAVVVIAFLNQPLKVGVSILVLEEVVSVPNRLTPLIVL